tara:strand:- start:491 stop:748 length:258 start_codon:yes stop_codon:yes gene_type:complete
MASIEIDIEDILWDMSDYEKQELVDELYSDGFIPEGCTPKSSSDTIESSSDGEEFDELVSNLLGNSWKLTKEDEEIIINICKKLV